MTKWTACRTPSTLLFIAVSIFATCPMLMAQVPAPSSLPTTPPSTTSFDVATIKPRSSTAGSSWFGIKSTADGMFGIAVTLVNLVRSAYAHQSFDQISGGPDWAKTDLFDLQAKMSEADIMAIQKLGPAEAAARRQSMMQSFLTERFKLKVHTENKQASVFELVVAKGGTHLRDSATDTGDLRLKKDGTPQTGILFSRDGTGVAQGESMESLVTFLSSPNAGLSRAVIDKTGLTGTYNFTLHWLPPPPSEWGSGTADGAMSSALQEVGLKLQPAMGPIQIVVIDHAERPLEN